MTNHDLIRLHIALMYQHITKPFLGQVVDHRVAYDLGQTFHDFNRDLVGFAQNLGEPDTSSWDDDDVLSEFDDVMQAEFKDVVSEARSAEDDILAMTRAVALQDEETRYKNHASAILTGWKNVNEVRIAENLEPVEGLRIST